MSELREVFFHSGIFFVSSFVLVQLFQRGRHSNFWMILFFLSFMLPNLAQLHGLLLGKCWCDRLFNNASHVLVIMPSLYLYAKQMVGKQSRSKKILLHMLPFVIFWCYFIFFPTSGPSSFLVETNGKKYMVQIFLLVFLASQFILYGYFAYKLIKENQLDVKKEYSYDSIYLNIVWIHRILSAFSIVGLLSIVASLIQVFNSDLEPTINYPIWASLGGTLFMVLTTGYFSLNQKPVFSKESNGKLEIEEKETTKPSLLSIEESKKIVEKLNALISSEKLFLNPTLKLDHVSRKSKIPKNNISYALNNFLKINFYTYINQFRIEHTKILLKDSNYNHYTIETIGQLSGFKSKSTFNSRFKEFVGKSPSEFKREIS